MPTKKIKIGFVGWGSHVQQHVRKFLSQDIVEIVAISGNRATNIDSAKRRRDTLGLSHVPFYPSKKEYDISDLGAVERMVEAHPEINALVVSTPHTMHYPQVKYGLENSLHVMVDKPLATSYLEAQNLVDLAKLKNSKLIVANQRRYETVYRYVIEQVKTGTLGRIRSINGILSHRKSWLQGWLANPTLSGGGAIYSIGHHLIDLIIWLVGEHVEQVQAYALFREKQLENYIDALIHFENGCNASISINHGAPENSVCERLQIWAENGVIVIDRFRPIHDSSPPQLLCQYMDGSIAPFDPTVRYLPPNSPAEDFVLAIMNDRPSVSSGEQNLLTVQTIEAIINSFNSGRTIEI